MTCRPELTTDQEYDLTCVVVECWTCRYHKRIESDTLSAAAQEILAAQAEHDDPAGLEQRLAALAAQQAEMLRRMQADARRVLGIPEP